MPALRHPSFACAGLSSAAAWQSVRPYAPPSRCLALRFPRQGWLCLNSAYRCHSLAEHGCAAAVLCPAPPGAAVPVHGGAWRSVAVPELRCAARSLPMPSQCPAWQCVALAKPGRAMQCRRVAEHRFAVAPPCFPSFAGAKLCAAVARRCALALTRRAPRSSRGRTRSCSSCSRCPARRRFGSRRTPCRAGESST